SRGIERPVKVFEQQPTRGGPGVVVPLCCEGAEDVRVVEATQFVHEGRFAAVEKILDERPGAVLRTGESGRHGAAPARDCKATAAIIRPRKSDCNRLLRQ